MPWQKEKAEGGEESDFVVDKPSPAKPKLPIVPHQHILLIALHKHSPRFSRAGSEPGSTSTPAQMAAPTK
jgi:hypothetical protein